MLEAFRAGENRRQALCAGRLHGRAGAHDYPGGEEAGHHHKLCVKGASGPDVGDREAPGVIAHTAAFTYAQVEDILEIAREKGEDPFIFLLDNIEDPHNLGAIIRTANLAGAHGVIIPKRRAAGLTAVAARASAGAVAYTPVAKVTNLNKTMEVLKTQGDVVCLRGHGRDADV